MQRIRRSLPRSIASVKDQLRDSFHGRYTFKSVRHGCPRSPAVPLIPGRVVSSGLGDPAWRVGNHPTRFIPISFTSSIPAGIGKRIVRCFVAGVDLVDVGLRSAGCNYRRQLQAICETLQYVIITALRMIDARISSIPDSEVQARCNSGRSVASTGALCSRERELRARQEAREKLFVVILDGDVLTIDEHERC